MSTTTLSARAIGKDRPMLFGVPRYVVASLAAVLSLFPFAFMVLGAFKDSGEFLDNPFGLPRDLTFANFGGLLTAEFGRYFLNSIVITGVSVVATCVLGCLAAYPLSRMRTRLNSPVMLVFLIGLMIPIHITLLPIYVLTQNLGLYNTLAAMFGPFIAFSLPVTIYVLSGFFQQIPESVLDAARMDGAGHGRVFTKMVVPLSMPAISTVAVINFIFAWNEFIFALVLLSSPENFPIPLGLTQFSAQYRVDVPGVMAALTVASLPSILFFLAAQEKVVSGLAAGAVAGE